MLFVEVIEGGARLNTPGDKLPSLKLPPLRLPKRRRIPLLLDVPANGRIKRIRWRLAPTGLQWPSRQSTPGKSWPPCVAVESEVPQPSC